MNTPTSKETSSVRDRSAAVYIRMSTDHQKFSVENQLVLLASYAQKNELTIVETFIDSGKSGLTLTRRSGLRDLLAKVAARDTSFGNILVLDVSRWGRFQDVDEGAHYEFLCRKAGIRLHYAGEQFQNDQSPISSIMKSIKRVMAAEYCRELSAKVKFGKDNIARKGFFLGGPPGYGLRRVMISEDGKIRSVLDPGEWKALQTDRVILRRGPRNEGRVIRQIYHLYVNKTWGAQRIANDLNAQGVPWLNGRPWSRSVIYKILTSEKYMGWLIVNKTSTDLGQRTSRRNPQDQWIVIKDAFGATVSADIFARAQYILARRLRTFTDEEVFRELRALLKKHGKLSYNIIMDFKGLPHRHSLMARFGGLFNLYKLAGYVPGPQSGQALLTMQTRRLLEATAQQMAAICKQAHILTERNKGRIKVLKIEGVRVSFTLCRWSAWLSRKRSHDCWAKIGDRKDISDFIVFIQFDRTNTVIDSYYVRPSKGLGPQDVPVNDADFGEYRQTSLEAVLAELQRLSRVG